MSKHTPGPWTVNIDIVGSNPDIQVQADAWGFVCGMGGGPRDLREANASLIAAAPELLAMLKDAARWIDTLPEDIRLGSIMPDKLRAAIAKAEGRS